MNGTGSELYPAAGFNGVESSSSSATVLVLVDS